MNQTAQGLVLIATMILCLMMAPAGMSHSTADSSSRAPAPKKAAQDHDEHEHEQEGHGQESQGSPRPDAHDHDHGAAGKPDEHDHAGGKEPDEHGHDHKGKEEDTEHGHGHGHGGARDNVGPNKGVTEASEDKGFALKEKVERNFSIQRMKLKAQSPLTVPTSSLLFSGADKQVFRFRGGFWKAVDVQILKRGPVNSSITSKELAAGDSIAISGVGFLKIINQSVFGPAIEGHVH